MRHRLDHLRVMVTRPLPQGQSLCEEIQAAGGTPIYFPTLKISPPTDQQALEKNIAALDQFDWVVFISPQAVLQSAQLIHQYWPIFPEHLRIACIGAGTAKTVREQRFPEAIFPEENWSSEGLLALPDFKQITAKKIALIKGADGQEQLAQELIARGAQVICVIAYQRELPTMTSVPAAAHVVVCTSGDSIKNLKILLQQNNITTTPLLVTSERMVKLAKELDFKQIFLAKNAGHHAILDELVNVRGQIMTAEQVEKKAATFSWARAFMVIVVCGLLATAGYYFWDHHKKTTTADILFQKKIQTVDQAVIALQAQNQQFSVEIKDQMQAIALLQQTQTSNKDTWVMLEAQYLVKLADDALQFENNTLTAIALLKRADDEVRALADSRLTDVRQALASDIAMLQAVQSVDTVGIYVRLNALSEEINKLPLPAKPDVNTASQPVDNQTLPWWKRGLQQTASALQKIVVVRYNANGTLPLLTPAQQDFLYQNLHAVLEKSMWGLLHKQADIYRLSLQQANEWTKKYFMQDSQVTQAFLTELDALQKVDVHPSMPKELVSMTAFSNYFSLASNKLAP